MKGKITTGESTKSKLRKILVRYSGTNMFMVLEPVKINIWNVLFHKKKLLSKIETNYIILYNEKNNLVQELRKLIK